MQRNDGTLYLNGMDRVKLLKGHTSKIMNEENERDQTVGAYAVNLPIEEVMREDKIEAFKHLKIGNASGLSEMLADMILRSGDVGIVMFRKLLQTMLDLIRLPSY